MYTIRKKDGWGRIGMLETNHGKMMTPVLLPVINPNRQMVSPQEMVRLGAEAFITNAYLLFRNAENRESVLQSGLHKYLGFSGPIMTDSGAFQLMQYGDVEVSNLEIIQFQEQIGSDIGVFLDVPVKTEKYEDHKAALEKTVKRAEENLKLRSSDNPILWAGPIQGGIHLDLIESSCEKMRKHPFHIHPLGSVVPLLEKYDYENVIRMLLTIKQHLPTNRPIHLFGAGHPMIFGIAVLLGVDVFDSAAYMLYAQKNRYITVTGTEYLENLEYFPCSCEVCVNFVPVELRHLDLETRTILLAKHNLIVSLEEIRRIRQAITEGRLYELALVRAAAHPSLMKNINLLFGKSTSKLVEPFETASKTRALLITHPILINQPLLLRYRQRIMERFFSWSSKLVITRENQKLHSSQSYQVIRLSPTFGIIPDELLGVYPLVQHERIPMEISSEIIEYIEVFLNRFKSKFKEILIHPSVSVENELLQGFDFFERPRSLSRRDDVYIIKAIVDYQFGAGSHKLLENINLTIERSQKTGVLRRFTEGDDLLGTFRASDFIIVPSPRFAEMLYNFLPRPQMRVEASDEAVPFVKQNKDLLAKFVIKADPMIRCGEEVLIVNKQGSFLNYGKSVLSVPEMLDFNRGVAVRVRR
ncbi:MAG: tRNA guanosine(15) transglycosylase TgtA [Candidatus Heimdallarchaeota archaeon]